MKGRNLNWAEGEQTDEFFEPHKGIEIEGVGVRKRGQKVYIGKTFSWEKLRPWAEGGGGLRGRENF